MEALETQDQTAQDKENSMAPKNMKYEMRSSRGMYRSLFTGKIYSTVLADQEKLTIDIKPAKKNMIPVIYYEDITTVLVNYKMSVYYIFWICLSVIAGIANHAMFAFALWFFWLGSNRKITICLRSGNKAVLYSNSKKLANEFANDVRSRANIG